MNKQSRIYVAGHRGLVGSAIVRRLRALNFEQLLIAEHRELDLTRQADVDSWFATHRPEIVIMAAAKVGGIHANNSYAAEFIRSEITNAAVFAPCDGAAAMQTFRKLELRDTPRQDFIEKFTRRRIMSAMAEEILALASTHVADAATRPST